MSTGFTSLTLLLLCLNSGDAFSPRPFGGSAVASHGRHRAKVTTTSRAMMVDPSLFHDMPQHLDSIRDVFTTVTLSGAFDFWTDAVASVAGATHSMVDAVSNTATPDALSSSSSSSIVHDAAATATSSAWMDPFTFVDVSIAKEAAAAKLDAVLATTAVPDARVDPFAYFDASTTNGAVVAAAAAKAAAAHADVVSATAATTSPDVWRDAFTFIDMSTTFDLADAATDTAAAASDAVATAPDAAAAAAVDPNNNGWFGFLTGPIEGLLQLIHSALVAVGVSADAWGVSIVVMTLLIKLVTYPLTKTQLESTNKMQALQPAIRQIQEKYQSNPEVMNQKIAEVYQVNEVNPLAGCLPSLVQIPVFIGLYRAVFLLAQDNKLDEPFLWLPNLEGPTYGADPTHGSDWILQGWQDGVPPLGWDNTIAFLILPVVLVASQYLSMELMQPKDQQSPQQNNLVLKLLPLMIGWFSLTVPAALCIYWVTNNIVSTATTLLIRNSMTMTTPVTSGSSGASATAAPPPPPIFSPPREKPMGFSTTTAPPVQDAIIVEDVKEKRAAAAAAESTPSPAAAAVESTTPPPPAAAATAVSTDASTTTTSSKGPVEEGKKKKKKNRRKN